MRIRGAPALAAARRAITIERSAKSGRLSVRTWIAVVVLCLLVAAGLGYHKYRQIQAAIAFGASFPEPVEAVEPFIVREELWRPTTSVTGEVVAIRSVVVSNELPGTIAEVDFAAGATVDAGQVLIRLDTSEERAQLAAAQADAEIARLDLARNDKLIASGAASEEARDRAKAQFDAANAVVRRLQAVIDKKTLRAPFAARAGLHELEIGQYLDKGAVIARLIGVSDQVWVDFTLPQEQAVLELGEAVQVGLPAHRSTGSGSAAEPFSARVIARDAFVNENSRNVSFRALAEDTGLSPGSLVTVEVPLGDARPATLIPVTAVRRSSFGANVFVLHPAEEGARAAARAELRPVKLGSQRGELMVISSGLRPGERVAANGSFKLREGVLVDPVSAEETAASAPAGDAEPGGASSGS